jgi:hypothetical protein
MSVSASTPPPPVPLKNVINTAIEKPSEILVHQSTHSLESNTSSSDSYSSMPSTPGSRSSSTLMTPSSSISDYYSQQQQQQQNQSQQQILDHSHIKPGKNASLLSYAQTITMYRKNAKRTNNPDIQCDFAKFLIEASQQQDSDSKNNKEYLVEAEKLLKQLSIKGHPESQYNLGKLYSMGVLNKKDKPDWDKAFNLYIQASKRNHADAANR